jgi:hypothetical protein
LSQYPHRLIEKWNWRASRCGIDLDLVPHVMVIKIVPNDKGNPPGKLADAELHFAQGELEGLKLVGFAIWERRNGPGRNVTFPARSYAINGERRSFALLRPSGDAAAQDRVRDLILQAYADYESKMAVAS